MGHASDSPLRPWRFPKARGKAVLQGGTGPGNNQERLCWMRGGRRNESGRSLSGQLHHWKTVSPLRASLIAQWVKNLPARQETQVQFLSREDPSPRLIPCQNHASAGWGVQADNLWNVQKEEQGFFPRGELRLGWRTGRCGTSVLL